MGGELVVIQARLVSQQCLSLHQGQSIGIAIQRRDHAKFVLGNGKFAEQVSSASVPTRPSCGAGKWKTVRSNNSGRRQHAVGETGALEFGK
jgi:hypothetical protein